ncbi:hypothetical protein PoB_002922800 [Plakobranchus ocellatus]|uniref:Uncharacterized protein n=1 Tax=Plakobranchus ocellatus TaxID=259542 RepID=A0AAV4A697_9GAST|nr:hypothetical protein PoB_002922800 [Plakobranchus ocellatus]
MEGTRCHHPEAPQRMKIYGTDAAAAAAAAAADDDDDDEDDDDDDDDDDHDHDHDDNYDDPKLLFLNTLKGYLNYRNA